MTRIRKYNLVIFLSILSSRFYKDLTFKDTTFSVPGYVQIYWHHIKISSISVPKNCQMYHEKMLKHTLFKRNRNKMNIPHPSLLNLLLLKWVIYFYFSAHNAFGWEHFPPPCQVANSPLIVSHQLRYSQSTVFFAQSVFNLVPTKHYLALIFSYIVLSIMALFKMSLILKDKKIRFLKCASIGKVYNSSFGLCNKCVIFQIQRHNSNSIMILMYLFIPYRATHIHTESSCPSSPM